jgi:hypothetical protein
MINGMGFSTDLDTMLPPNYEGMQLIFDEKE